MANMLPTKSNLLAAKRSRKLAYTGFSLMDKKRSILMREIMGLIDKAQSLQEQIDTVFSDAYTALRAANIDLGKCDQIAESVPPDTDVTFRHRSVMGVEIPMVYIDPKPLTLPYGFIDTSSTLDVAYINFNKVKELIRDLAETENTILRLAYNIKKTQKRSNALKNVVIPDFDKTIKEITDSLEEKEREEFVRLKVIKNNR